MVLELGGEDKYVDYSKTRTINSYDPLEIMEEYTKGEDYSTAKSYVRMIEHSDSVNLDIINGSEYDSMYNLYQKGKLRNIVASETDKILEVTSEMYGSTTTHNICRKNMYMRESTNMNDSTIRVTMYVK